MISLRGGRVAAGGEERAGWWVTVEGGVVAEVGPQPPAAAEHVDLGDADLLPGLVDLHSDCLKQRVRPRPSMELPLAAALSDLDAEVVAHGITTHFLCLALDEDDDGFRTERQGQAVLAALEDVGPALHADHRVHLRVDVAVPDLAGARRLARRGQVGLVSYMDHTPGQGQYTDEARWRSFYASDGGLAGVDLDELLARKRDGRAGANAARAAVAAIAREAGAVLASHDDDSPAAVARAVALGARIAEFPVTMDAAAAAVELGMGTVMGAPNARRGGSHVGNLSARTALATGRLTALASDYHPPSLLAAAYELADAGACGWAQAVRVVTEGPARLAGLPDRGRVEPGLRADLVAVRRVGGRPRVAQVWVGGAPMLGLGLRVGARAS
jgi:alpha-D-ribose 1-methylphosphonate 5-triphosphate diphosphatase